MGFQLHERNSFNKEPKCNRVRTTFADERKQFILNGQVAKRLSTWLLTTECDENSSMQVRVLSCPLIVVGSNPTPKEVALEGSVGETRGDNLYKRTEFVKATTR